MLNEERVKHMTKLAFYETNGGSEELKIGFYHKKDYIGLHTFLTSFWVTVAYALFLLLIIMTFMGNIFEVLSGNQIIAVLSALFGLYLIIVLSYAVRTRKVHKKKHARAYHHVKQFNEELGKLEKMYEQEENHE